MAAKPRCQCDGGDWGFVVLLCWLAPSAYLASAASTATLVLKLLPSFLHHISDRSSPNALAPWQSAVEPAALAPVDLAATRQHSFDDPCCQHSSTLLLDSAVEDRERARLRASLTATSGAWLQALPIASVWACGWMMTSSGWRWVCVTALTCARPHTCTCGCPCGCPGHARVGLQAKCWTFTPAMAYSTHVVWRAMLHASRCHPARNRRASVDQTGSALTASRSSPGHEAACQKSAWDVTSLWHPGPIPSSIISNPGRVSSRSRAEAAKTLKCDSALTTTHAFVPIAFETLGGWGCGVCCWT